MANPTPADPARADPTPAGPNAAGTAPAGAAPAGTAPADTGPAGTGPARSTGAVPAAQAAATPATLVRRRKRFLIYLAAAGPGLIAAAAGNDAGGVATYSSAGSEFGYRTLFLMVLIAIAYVVVQEMVARLSVHTGKGLAALIREQFPLRLTAFAVGAFAVANIGLVVT